MWPDGCQPNMYRKASAGNQPASDRPLVVDHQPGFDKHDLFGKAGGEVAHPLDHMAEDVGVQLADQMVTEACGIQSRQ